MEGSHGVHPEGGDSAAYSSDDASMGDDSSDGGNADKDSGEVYYRNKGGRPRKAVKMSNYPVHVLMPSEEELDLIKFAARYQGQALSAWARGVLLDAARRIVANSTSIQPHQYRSP